MKIPERTEKYKQGLIDMIEWIDKFSPVRMMKIIEIGVWTGCASEIFAKRFNKVICVDMWKNNIGGITDKYDMKEVEKIFDSRQKKYHGVICKSKMSSIEAAKIYQDHGSNEKINDDIFPDIIYIDAKHLFNDALEDILTWKDIPKRFICGHDYEKRFPGVVKAVNKIFGKPQKIFQDTSWIVRIINE